MTIGEITTGRKRANMTLRELAESVIKEDGKPISISYLNDVEHDRRQPPAPYLMRQIADKLHLSYEYLLFLAGDMPEDVREGEHAGGYRGSMGCFPQDRDRARWPQ